MELHQLKIFVAVAEEKHLTRAAERVFSSQPAVSAQIKSLEEQLGLRLFDRTPKGMTLTPAGEQLLEQARSTLASAASLMNAAKSLQGSIVGELEVGTNSDIAFLRLPQIIAALKQQHPHFKLSLVQSMSTDILRDVRKGLQDTGFFFGPNPLGGLHCLKLAEVATAVVAPAAWAEQISQASVETLARMPWVYTKENCPFYLLKETLFEHSKTKPEKALFVDTEESIRAFIRAEQGISLLREDDADQAVRDGWGVRWKGQTPRLDLSVAVLENRRREPEMTAWLNALENIWDIESSANEQAAG
jgi:DNA-binding transcriptional LysR family regulator